MIDAVKSDSRVVRNQTYWRQQLHCPSKIAEKEQDSMPIGRQNPERNSPKNPNPRICGNWSLVNYLQFLQKLCSWVSIGTSSSLEGRSAGKSDRQTTAILTAISISSSSTSSPRMLLSNASLASPACCKWRSHRPKLPPPAASLKNGSMGSLPVSRTPSMTPKLNTSLFSVYLWNCTSIHHQHSRKSDFNSKQATQIIEKLRNRSHEVKKNSWEILLALWKASSTTITLPIGNGKPTQFSGSNDQLKPKNRDITKTH